MEEMPQPEQGMNLDPQILIQVQQNFLMQARAKEVQLEAAVQQLSMENAQLTERLAALEPKEAKEG